MWRRERSNPGRWLWLIPALLLLAGYCAIETPFVDKVYGNPIDEEITALEFQLADGSASIRLNDADTIDALRRAHRWTNRHMYCCLAPDQVYAYVYEATNGRRNPAEPLKIYAGNATPSFNLEFRLLLRQVCDELLGK